MKKIVGFLCALSVVTGAHALGDTINKAHQSVGEIKSNLEKAGTAISAGDVSTATQHIDKAKLALGDASEAVTAIKNKVKDVVTPKINMVKESLKNIHGNASTIHDKAQELKNAVKDVVKSHMENDPQSAKKHAEKAYDILTELLPELESLKHKLFETEKKTEMLHEEKSENPFTRWFHS